MLKKLPMILPVLFLAAIVAVSLVAGIGSLPEEQDSLIFLMKTEATENEFYGQDGNGHIWLVHGEHDPNDDYAWVRFSGDAKEATDGVALYEITAARTWYHMDSIHEEIGIVYDTCMYDIDNDGTEEECILSAPYSPAMGATGYSDIRCLSAGTVRLWNVTACFTPIPL